MPRDKEDKPVHGPWKTDPPYQGASCREVGERIIRCFHTDQRPPHPDDSYEFHWRCTATFQCYEGEPPYCPYHSPIYTHRERATQEDIQKGNRAMVRYQRHVTETIPYGLAVTPSGDDLLTGEDLTRLRQHRDEQLARARQAGLEV